MGGRTTARAASSAAIVALIASFAFADDADRSASIPLFAIRKSENRNRVEYALAVDSSCRPRGSSPVFAYWRMLERSPTARESLDLVERPAYGIATQRTAQEGDGFRVDLTLRALHERRIVVHTSGSDGRCNARTTTTIEGVECALDDIYVVLAGPTRIDHIELRGHALTDGSSRLEIVDR